MEGMYLSLVRYAIYDVLYFVEWYLPLYDITWNVAPGISATAFHTRWPVGYSFFKGDFITILFHLLI
jgi:hypothetical protein